MINQLIVLADYLDQHNAFEEAEELDTLINKMAGEQVSLESVLEQLSVVADKLDEVGSIVEAEQVDTFIKKVAEDLIPRQKEKDTDQSKRYDSKFHHSLQIREPKNKQERVDTKSRETHHVKTYETTNAISLNTRYCPMHIGYSLIRVGENTYQCPLDGAVYNWEIGWEDYEGNKHPGGSVANQTPNASDYAAPNRIFNNKDNFVNKR